MHVMRLPLPLLLLLLLLLRRFDEFDVALALWWFVIVAVGGDVSGDVGRNTWLNRPFSAGFRVNPKKGMLSTHIPGIGIGKQVTTNNKVKDAIEAMGREHSTQTHNKEYVGPIKLSHLSLEFMNAAKAKTCVSVYNNITSYTRFLLFYFFGICTAKLTVVKCAWQSMFISNSLILANFVH